MATLVLWDVDGTLLRGGAAARDALADAIGRVLARDVRSDGIQMSGKTDPLILAELAHAAGVERHDIDEVVDAAVQVLPSCFAGIVDRFVSDGHVLPGIQQLLERLHLRGDVLQTLLTGNLQETGIGKVAAFGLDRWFVPEVGAYGSDDAVRDRLVPVALARAEEHLGDAIDREATWVVGDTPRDLACARAGGVRCLLVATGRYTIDELSGLGADAVLEDLTDTDHVESVLTGRS